MQSFFQKFIPKPAESDNSDDYSETSGSDVDFEVEEKVVLAGGDVEHHYKAPKPWTIRKPEYDKPLPLPKETPILKPVESKDQLAPNGLNVPPILESNRSSPISSDNNTRRAFDKRQEPAKETISIEKAVEIQSEPAKMKNLNDIESKSSVDHPLGADASGRKPLAKTNAESIQESVIAEETKSTMNVQNLDKDEGVIAKNHEKEPVDVEREEISVKSDSLALEKNQEKMKQSIVPEDETSRNTGDSHAETTRKGWSAIKGVGYETIEFEEKVPKESAPAAKQKSLVGSGSNLDIIRLKFTDLNASTTGLSILGDVGENAKEQADWAFSDFKVEGDANKETMSDIVIDKYESRVMDQHYPDETHYKSTISVTKEHEQSGLQEESVADIVIDKYESRVMDRHYPDETHYKDTIIQNAKDKLSEINGLGESRPSSFEIDSETTKMLRMAEEGRFPEIDHSQSIFKNEHSLDMLIRTVMVVSNTAVILKAAYEIKQLEHEKAAQSVSPPPMSMQYLSELARQEAELPIYQPPDEILDKYENVLDELEDVVDIYFMNPDDTLETRQAFWKEKLGVMKEKLALTLPKKEVIRPDQGTKEAFDQVLKEYMSKVTRYENGQDDLDRFPMLKFSATPDKSTTETYDKILSEYMSKVKTYENGQDDIGRFPMLKSSVTPDNKTKQIYGQMLVEYMSKVKPYNNESELSFESRFPCLNVIGKPDSAVKTEFDQVLKEYMSTVKRFEMDSAVDGNRFPTLKKAKFGADRDYKLVFDSVLKQYMSIVPTYTGDHNEPLGSRMLAVQSFLENAVGTANKQHLGAKRQMASATPSPIDFDAVKKQKTVQPILFASTSVPVTKIRGRSTSEAQAESAVGMFPSEAIKSGTTSEKQEETTAPNVIVQPVIDDIKRSSSSNRSQDESNLEAIKDERGDTFVASSPLQQTKISYEQREEKTEQRPTDEQDKLETSRNIEKKKEKDLQSDVMEGSPQKQVEGKHKKKHKNKKSVASEKSISFKEAPEKKTQSEEAAGQGITSEKQTSEPLEENVDVTEHMRKSKSTASHSLGAVGVSLGGKAAPISPVRSVGPKDNSSEMKTKKNHKNKKSTGFKSKDKEVNEEGATNISKASDRKASAAVVPNEFNATEWSENTYNQWVNEIGSNSKDSSTALDSIDSTVSASKVEDHSSPIWDALFIETCSKALAELDVARSIKGDVDEFGRSYDWPFWMRIVEECRSNPVSTELLEKNSQIIEHITSEKYNGVPLELRPIIWIQFSNNMRPNNLLPVETAFEELSFIEKAKIERDIGHIFPDDPKYNTDKDKLGKLLCSYLSSDPTVVYDRGLAFVAGIIVLQENEVDSLILLKRLMYHYDLRRDFTPGIEGLRLNLYQYDMLLEQSCPDLSRHFQTLGVRSQNFAGQWYMALFSYQMPLEFVYEVYDYYLLEGPVALHKVAIALTLANKTELMHAETSDEIYTILNQNILMPYGTDYHRILVDANSVTVDNDFMMASQNKFYELSRQSQYMAGADEIVACKLEGQKLMHQLAVLTEKFQYVLHDREILTRKVIDQGIALQEERQRNYELASELYKTQTSWAFDMKVGQAEVNSLTCFYDHRIKSLEKKIEDLENIRCPNCKS